MKKTVEKCDVSTGPARAFLERSLTRAGELDRGEKFRAQMRVTFADPVDLLRVLTAQRVWVLAATI